MGTAIKKCTQELMDSLKALGYEEGTWPSMKNFPLDEMSLCTYACVRDDIPYETFAFFRVMTEVCFDPDPRYNWIENREVFDDEESFLAYAASERFHYSKTDYNYKNVWFIDVDGLFKKCETKRPKKEDFPPLFWHVATPEEISNNFPKWIASHKQT